MQDCYCKIGNGRTQNVPNNNAIVICRNVMFIGDKF